MESIYLYEGVSHDPHYNLAVEQYLLEGVKPGQCILYLWQNQNTVVIGRNQNPWKECRTALLAEEGGTLARRLSGGGAVYHDLGNLNFTFLVSQGDYDLDRQLQVIQQGVSLLGLKAERSGRNDLLTQGRKFSGNAFYQNGTQAYHHGTLLVAVDMDKLGRYLSPSRAKLQSKGVESVRSRVVNLQELNPQATVPALSQALAQAFSQVYGLPLQRMTKNQLAEPAIEDLARKNRSWDWCFGRKLAFAFDWEERFPWGSVQIQLDVDAGRIGQAQVYTDAMDWQLAPHLESLLSGCRLASCELKQRLGQCVSNQEAQVLTRLAETI